MFAGENFTLIQTSKSLISFGGNRNGELGRGGDPTIPKKIDFFENFKIDQVSCGKCHSLVLTKKGNLYSFGDNSYNQLGHENEILYYSEEPILIDYFKEKEIEKISAGSEHSFVYCSKNI